jgi:uncharacterized LabA/DUF88 family protein
MKTCCFIDGANLYHSMTGLGWDLDYGALREDLDSRFDLLRIFYYTALLQGENPLRPLCDWLQYHGFHLVTKPAKVFGTFTKGNMDIDLAVDALEMAPFMEHMILFSGDGDFRRLVESIQRRGIKVTVISTAVNTADELRKQCDVFVELQGMRKQWERK